MEPLTTHLVVVTPRLGAHLPARGLGRGSASSRPPGTVAPLRLPEVAPGGRWEPRKHLPSCTVAPAGTRLLA
jgi:hypothetical protein